MSPRSAVGRKQTNTYLHIDIHTCGNNTKDSAHMCECMYV